MDRRLYLEKSLPLCHRGHPVLRTPECRGPPARCAEAADHGVSIVLGTIGEDGSYVLDYNGKTYYASAVYADDVIDTMGAGDSYFAAFLCSLLKSSKAALCWKAPRKRRTSAESHADRLQHLLQNVRQRRRIRLRNPIVGRTEL